VSTDHRQAPQLEFPASRQGGRGTCFFISCIAVLFASWLAAKANAQASVGNIGGAYPNATSGILAGTVPPKGHYWLMYHRFYHAPVTTDDFGNAQPVGFTLDTYVNAHRIVTVTDKKILGADFAWNFVVPIVWIDSEVTAYGIEDTAMTLADMNVEPFVIEWHEKQFDFGFVFGLFAPTAPYNSNQPALPGRDYWTLYPGLAGTYYFDEAKSWHVSALSRYEFHTDRVSDGFHRGDDLSFEWGAGKSFQEQGATFGVSGYCSWQVTDNEGNGAYPKDRAYGIGPEIQYFSTKWKWGYHLRHWFEFGARNRTEGEITTFTLVKPF
jgi:hypothetical protein